MVIFNPIFCGTPKKDSYFSILAIGPLPCCLVLTLLTMLSLRNSVAHTKFLQVFLVALHGPLLSGRPPGDGDAAGMAITVPADDACDIDDRNSSVKVRRKKRKRWKSVLSQVARPPRRSLRESFIRTGLSMFRTSSEIISRFSTIVTGPIRRSTYSVGQTCLKHQQHFIVHKTIQLYRDPTTNKSPIPSKQIHLSVWWKHLFYHPSYSNDSTPIENK